MSGTRRWLILSGALALGAGAAVGVSGDFGPDVQSGGPGVRLYPATSASTVPGVEQADLTGASVGTEPAAGQAAAITPPSPEPVNPAAPTIPDSAGSPMSASPDSAGSPESAD